MSSAIKLGPSLRELRIHLCQNGAASKGVREFIEAYYIDLKINNPTFPILIRECSGIKPRLWARYGKGKEACLSLADLSCADVLCKIESVAK